MLLQDLTPSPPPLERRGQRFARYGDDFLSVVKRRRAGERVTASLTRFLRQHLQLELNAAKSRVGPTTEGTVLGFTFHGPPIYGSTAALQDFRSRLRQLTGRRWGVSLTPRLHKLTEYSRGWLPYFGLSQY